MVCIHGNIECVCDMCGGHNGVCAAILHSEHRSNWVMCCLLVIFYNSIKVNM